MNASLIPAFLQRPSGERKLDVFKNEVGTIVLGPGHEGSDMVGLETYHWLGKQGTIYIHSAVTQLVLVKLTAEPYVSRCQTIVFDQKRFAIPRLTEISIYRSVIPGNNPIEFLFEGTLECPKDRGDADDSRMLSVRLRKFDLIHMGSAPGVL